MCRLFQITNLMHNSFIFQQYVCYTTILNMFRAARCSSSGGQPLVSSPSVSRRTVCRWRADLESFEMWCWRRMEKISWTDHVRNEEVLLRVNEQRNILHEIREWKANWIGHILRRNCLLKQFIEGKIKGEMEVKRRRARRRKKLLDDLKNRRGYSHLKEEALDRTIWRHRFGGGFGPVVRQNTEWINELMSAWQKV